MKTIIALAISSFIAAGAYAKTTTVVPAQVTKTTETTTVSDNGIDNSSRQAILAALGADGSDTIKKTTTKTVVSPTVTVIKTEQKPVVLAKAAPEIVKTDTVKTVTTVTTVQPQTVVKTETKTTTKVDTKTVTNIVPEVKNVGKSTVKVVTVETKPAEVKVVTPVAATVTTVKTNTVETKAPIKHKTKHVVKHHVKHVTHYKKVVKKTQGIDLVKSPFSVSETPYEAIPVVESPYLKSNQVVASLSRGNNNTIVVNFSDLNGHGVGMENFRTVNNASAMSYVVSSDLKTITSSPVYLSGNSTSYQLTTPQNMECKHVFFQYQLKTSQKPVTLAAHFNQSGAMTSSLDSGCKTSPIDSHDNISHSPEDNIIGIFTNDYAPMSKKPLKYSIVNNRHGKTYTPKDLESFIVSQDFNQFYNVPHDSNLTGTHGNKFEQKLNSGVYYIIGQFHENGKPEQIITSVEVQ
jgi:hypothetical protein